MRKDKVIAEQINIKQTLIEEEELDKAIKRLKIRKTGGPDETTIEMFKAMDEGNRDIIRKVLNEWWSREEIDKEALRARVVHIFKKGNTSNLANYRPISLLNTMYKLFAAITQDRMAQGIDHCLHKTQYGFRKAKKHTAGPAFDPTYTGDRGEHNHQALDE